MNMNIRKAIPSDAEAWARIRKICWLDVYPNKEHDITREHWLKEVRSPKYEDKNICLFGVGLFPWKVGFPDDVIYAYLSVDQNLRKDRLIDRGDPHLYQAYQKDITEIVRKLDEAGAKKIDNSNRPIEQTAREIKDWLKIL